MLTIQRRLVEFLLPRAENRTVTDVRIGLKYTAVKLDSGHAGVAWTPHSPPSGCAQVLTPGQLAGSSARERLRTLAAGDGPFDRAVGLATANALLAGLAPQPAIDQEVIASLGLTADDHVAMVGFFGPVIPRIRQSGCRLEVIEINPHIDEGTLSPEEGARPLAACTVAIISGTTLITATFDEVTAALGHPRAAVLLGPTTPLCPEVFHDTKITHVAGSRVLDADAVLRIVSEGGGTKLLKPHVEFRTLRTSTGPSGSVPA